VRCCAAFGVRGANVPGSIWISFGVFWLGQIAIIIRSRKGIKPREAWPALLLLGSGALLLWWAIIKGSGLLQIRSESPWLQRGSTPFWTLCPATLS